MLDDLVKILLSINDICFSRSLIEQSRRRVLVFRNGQGSQGVEIVADPERFEDVISLWHK